MRLSIFVVFAVFLLSFSCSESSPDAKSFIGVKELNKLMSRGINLGNALEAPTEGEWGVVIKEEYFKIIKDAGFSTVRIPIRWSNHALLDSPYTIDSNFLKRVDWAVDQALKNNLITIINVHHYNEMYSNPSAEKKRFLALWRQIANYFKERPATLLFEILNEPHDQLTPALWNQYLAEALAVIRETNPDRAVIIGTANWGGLNALDDLQVPEDENLIFTFHYYSPFQFTHQGADWVEGSDTWLGTIWSGSEEEKQTILSDFDRARQWAEAHDIPVFLGEFGAYSKADSISRLKWTSFVARTAEKYGFSWAYWEFCSSFGAFDPVANQWRTGLLKTLIPE